jgi:hypothetical protein
MTLKSEQKLQEICDLLHEGNSYSTAARLAGVKPRTVFHWLKLSAADDPDFLIRYMGDDEPTQFCNAAALARKALHFDMRANFERRNLLGWDEVVTFGGAVQYQVDVRTVGWTPDEREAYGFRKDGYAENSKGEVIPLTIHREPPVAAVLATLAMSFPEEYTPASTQNINVVNSDTGVQRAAAIDGQKIAIPPKPPRPEALPAPEPSAVEDADYQDLLGPDPEAKPATDTDPAALPIPPGIQPDDRVVEPVIRTATPPEYSSQPNPILRTGARQRSPLELSLLAELDKSLAKAKGTPS